MHIYSRGAFIVEVHSQSRCIHSRGDFDNSDIRKGWCESQPRKVGVRYSASFNSIAKCPSGNSRRHWPLTLHSYLTRQNNLSSGTARKIITTCRGKEQLSGSLF